MASVTAIPDSRPSVLVVDDSAATREVIERHLLADGYDVEPADSVPAAVDALRQRPFDVIITDMRMPGADGLELVRHARERHRDAAIVMVTGFATVGGAVSAMREGVDDYLAKPFSDEELRHAVRTALERTRARRTGAAPAPADPADPVLPPEGLIGNSPPMRRVYHLIDRAAAAGVPVLITGESGTGKELVARAIHYRGPRAAGPFLAVNCAAIPESLLESELFGHARGAFTGASAARPGYFASADGGTLFLDEVGELSTVAQAKLLRVLQERAVQAVGADHPTPVDVRIIAATNRDLEGLARDGVFRQDLFFRLHVLPIELPPLRERGDDIAALFRHFVALAASQDAAAPAAPAPRLTDAAIDAMRRYPWPGNVRELQNLAQRLVVFADSGVVDAADLPEPIRTATDRAATPPHAGAVLRRLRDVELDHIRAVLESVGGNKTKAADILGIDRKSLRERLKAAPPRDPSRGVKRPTGEN